MDFQTSDSRSDGGWIFATFSLFDPYPSAAWEAGTSAMVRLLLVGSGSRA
jgi:hypothetical protein